MKTLTIAAMLCVTGAAHADILLDQRPTSVASTGYSVGNSFYQWKVYQPFTVSAAEGWTLQKIWLDGFKFNGSGNLLVEIATSDTGAALASTNIVITNPSSNSYVSVFDAGNINVFLPGNTSYVMRISESEGADIGLHYGLGGTPIRAKNALGTTINQANSISTYFEGTLAPTPGSIGLLSLSGLVALRRRRN